MKATNTFKYANDVDVDYYRDLVAKQVGSINELKWQTWGNKEVAGQYEILSFTPYEQPEFKYQGLRSERENKPDTLILGTYEVKLHDTKKYKKEVFTFEVSMYFSQDNFEYNEYISVSGKNEKTGKYLKAYSIGFVPYK